MLTTESLKPEVDPSYPSRWEAIVFRCKASLLQVRRSILNQFIHPVQCYSSNDALLHQPVLAESITSLWTSQEAVEKTLIAGKIENLRVAVRQINGIEIPANGLFSFWAQVGRPTQQKGYVVGRELRQGCIIPNLGGGLCQLSNALYSAALDARLAIVERHAHTQVIPGSLAEIGRDATVFWNYVDLRFQSLQPLRIEAFLTQDSLVVRFKGVPVQSPLPDHKSTQDKAANDLQNNLRTPEHSPQSCLTCGVTGCFRNAPINPTQTFGKTAYLVDEYWPEFDAYLQSHRQPQDLLASPLNGQHWKKANYAWNQTGFGTVKSATGLTLKRAIASRRLPAQGSSLQQLLLHFNEKLAQQYAAFLPYDVLHITVMQNLLPFLWMQGSLGGRTYDVLMTRLPLSVLQQRLDQAHQNHPESPTLADFRSSADLIEAETQVLRGARLLITPHAEIAALFPQKAVLLDWHLPTIQTPPKPGNRILFPASTLGRKGAYELRKVALELDLELTVLGRELEGEAFWQGLTVHAVEGNALDGIGLVVLPAYVEHQPRILLRAIAAQIPVIATTACGLDHIPQVTTIPTGHEAALKQAILFHQSKGMLPMLKP
ncbi:MAG: VanW family protein [Oculatellaceae cyanobacterium Prado106]|nr:VanW family protein [Oculatellaceae cyanobacterium Prado106]